MNKLYKYIYQEYRHNVYIYNKSNITEIGSGEISEFIKSLDKNESVGNWLKDYIKTYYQESPGDGQLLPEYIINRTENIYGRNELNISWRGRGSSL